MIRTMLGALRGPYTDRGFDRYLASVHSSARHGLPSLYEARRDFQQSQHVSLHSELER